MTDARQKVRWLVWPAFGLLALINAGCLLAVCGAAAGGAAATGYLYYNGLLYRDYNANIADSLAAVRTSLQELQFPIVEEKSDTGTAYVKTRTGDGHTVRIYIDIVPSPIPAEGALTRVGIRVGFSGDEPVSARILDQVSSHLVARAVPPAVPAPGPPLSASQPPGPTLLPPRPVPVQETAATPPGRVIPVSETSPPPLAATPPAGGVTPR
jgi:hypothetical protein